MEKTVLNVDGMSCQHCVNAVTNAVTAISGVQGVQVDLAAKTVTVQHEAAVAVDKIKAEIEDQGYDVLS